MPPEADTHELDDASNEADSQQSAVVSSEADVASESDQADS